VTERLRSFERDGLTFDVVDAGPIDGEVVILLHGFPQDSTCWDDVSGRLNDAGYRTLAPDQRGYSPGARPEGTSQYRFRELVDDVLALADSAGVERFHVVAHDWGALVAWALAADQPTRVASLTSLSVPHPSAFRASLWHGQLLRSWYMGLFQVPRLSDRLIEPGSWMWSQLVRGLPEPAADHYAQRMAVPGALAAALTWYRAMPGELRSPSVRVGRLTVATLYVWGAKDPALARAAAELTGRYVAGPYQFEVLDRAGHWLPERHGEQVADLALRHLRSHPSKV
jgi:pimeloyl-ACP methyl ester carboxylesterase